MDFGSVGSTLSGWKQDLVNLVHGHQQDAQADPMQGQKPGALGKVGGGAGQAIGPQQFRQAGLITEAPPADMSMLNAAIGAK